MARLGGHRRRAEVLAQGARGDQHLPARVRRFAAHGISAHPDVPAARPRSEQAQSCPDQRPGRSDDPHRSDQRLRQRLPWSVPAVLCLAVLVGVVLHRSVWGSGSTCSGRTHAPPSARACPSSGPARPRFMIGGAMAGLAGAVMLAGGTANYRYTPGFANNVGWEGRSWRSSPATGRSCASRWLFAAPARDPASWPRPGSSGRSSTLFVRCWCWRCSCRLPSPPSVGVALWSRHHRRRCHPMRPSRRRLEGAPCDRDHDRKRVRRSRRRSRIRGDVQLGDSLRHRAGVRGHRRVGCRTPAR